MQSDSPLGRFISPVKSLEGEQSAVLAFYAGAQNAHVGQTERPREEALLFILLSSSEMSRSGSRPALSVGRRVVD